MSCAPIREQLLELDVADFDAIPHLASCPACRGFADAIRAAEAGLADHVASFAAGGEAFEAAWERAEAAADQGEARGPRIVVGRLAAGLALSAGASLQVGLVLAVAASLLVVVRSGPTWPTTPPTGPVDVPSMSPAPAAATPAAPSAVAPAMDPAAPAAAAPAAAAPPAVAPPAVAPPPTRASPPVAAPAPRPRPPPTRAPAAPRPRPRTAPAPAPTPAPAPVPAPDVAPRPTPTAPPRPSVSPVVAPSDAEGWLEIEVGDTAITAGTALCDGSERHASFDGSRLRVKVLATGCRVVLAGPTPLAFDLGPGRIRLASTVDGIVVRPR